MKIITADQVHQTMRFPELIEALRSSFGHPAGAPKRTVFRLDASGTSTDAFAVLPAWNEHTIAVKAFTYFPENPAHGFETLYSMVMLFDRNHGVPLALVDGTSITYWRTAAVSALGADYLARDDAQRLLVCGTGNLAPYMAAAHAAIRPISEIEIWGRSHAKATVVANQLAERLGTITVRATRDLEASARAADMISCATASHDPILYGAWIKPGTHVDMVGNHEPQGRECDTALITGASVYVDSRANVLHEAGELRIPIEEGVWNEAQVRGELAELCSKTVPGRTDASEITVLKTVGTALSDLTGARLVFDACS